ncbi:hypothetical protein BBO_06771 [Beauveria brongniartii RCEF 3172]|uniref:Uncharacterized protein n=1 Tax=Beauveria brongniartii RCEF 3172 TaxID=1081107 RepID=A0A162J3F5_9HYPO|nr:hypothetical protein BBO_06771 [Beauveria brongniartii RCEF 3172]
MVLPEKLVRVGLGLGSFLPSTAPDVSAASHDVLKLRDLGGLVGSSTTDLVRFSSTLKVARAIVEEHKRAEVIEVPTSSLVSILDRIKALEKEVEDLLNGKKVNQDSKGIEPLESGPASGDSVFSSPKSSPDGGSSGKSSGGSSGGSSSSSSDGESSIISGSSSDGGSDSSSSPSNKNSASGSNSSGGSTSTPESKPGSTGGLTTEETDCAPEHLLYRLGGGSVQRRSVTVSEHPLFRRTTNCTLDSVSGGSKGKNLPSGAAVFKEDSSSATVGGASPASGDGSADSNDGTAGKSGTTKSDTKSDTASPATDKSAEKSADESDNNFADKFTNKSGDDSDDKSAALDSQSVLSSASADGGAGKQDGASLTLTSPPSATTAATNVESEAEGSAAESEEETTITTTMTSTSYTTVTVYRRPSFTKAGLDGKYANATASISAPASASHFFENGTANSTATNTPPSPAALLFITGATGSASSPSATEISSASSVNNSSAAAADGVRAESTTTGSGQIFFENNSTASQPEAVASPSLPNTVGDVRTSSLQTVSSLASAAVTGEKVAVSPATVTSTTTSTTTITITPVGSAVKKPEAATSALATDINGALAKRRSGFQTVRTSRRRTADADEHF